MFDGGLVLGVMFGMLVWSVGALGLLVHRLEPPWDTHLGVATMACVVEYGACCNMVWGWAGALVAAM